jgi:lipoprotein NlpI
MRPLAIALAILTLAVHAVAADTADDLLKEARAAWQSGKTDEALTQAGKAIALEPKNPSPLLFRGTLYEALARHDQAVADFSAAIALDPRSAEAYYRRGSEQFKRGKVAESLADFDKQLDLRPDDRPGHWKRGISCYYAGKFEEGKKQFEGYEKVDTNDVENAVWHFLCNARLAGLDKSRGQLLKIGKDKRVPMSQVYELFAGKLKPDDVLQAAREGRPAAQEENTRLFYAHLYLGLYAEAVGDPKKALEHLTEAATKHKIGHYMWDVARVHMEQLQKERDKAPKP